VAEKTGVAAEELISRVASAYSDLKESLAQVIVGQERIVEDMFVALLCRGHCLIIGVPGLAKTLLIRSLGRILGLSFSRIQFTPDLMPTDIIGADILQQDAKGGRRVFEFKKGPIFANFILADEINRTPPKTQAALLEAMQELAVTAGGRTMPLAPPFLVFATQNPIEHEGTYPLPEAQLDRFFFCLLIDYPSYDEEYEVVLRNTRRQSIDLKPVFSAEEILQLQDIVLDVPAPPHAVHYALTLARASRPKDPLATEHARKFIEWGAGPRASMYLVLAAKALALLRKSPAVSCEEIRRVAPEVLRHRIIPNYNATGEGVTIEDIIARLLKEVPEPSYKE